MATFESSFQPRLIYVFTIPFATHEGCLKVGMTTLGKATSLSLEETKEAQEAAAHARIRQYTQTAGIPYQLLHTELAFFVKDAHLVGFEDSEVHRVLERSGVERKRFEGAEGAHEWFVTDLETVKRAIQAVREGRDSLGVARQASTEHKPIVFRPEQQEAIDRTVKQFRRGSRMLWNAKMRFGKTLCALQVVREMEVRRTIILTHRPEVADSWFDDFRKIFYDRPDYHNGSRARGDGFASLEAHAQQGGHYVYFASMQDLRGAQIVGGQIDKHHEIFGAEWDLLIVDEAHEGTQTALGEAVINELTKPRTKVLQLSGTPFNLLDGYIEDEIFTWDYVMEQRAKAEWDVLHLGEPNPYAGLPAINIYTYDLGTLMAGAGEYEADERAFNFREFFRTREGDGSFVHEADVDAFLDLLCRDDEESLYPYATKAHRDIFRHTLWVLPGVSAARAMSQKLRAHPVFGAFEVVNVAGEGDEDAERADALQMVRNAIGEDPSETFTITLTCGRLTTGVSVRPWTGVFMMAGSYSTSAAGYMQTIFRVQTPFEWRGQIKTQCYAFDFAPDRTLRMLADVAKVSARAGKSTQGDRTILGDFLNFCPIISIDGSRMLPYNVDRMMGELKRAQIERVVQGGFEDGALYNGELLKLTEVDLNAFKQLRGIIGRTKAMHKTSDITINQQGLTGEVYSETSEDPKGQKRPKRELTPEEKARLEELKERNTQRREAISILRGISIRMPLLIFGAELKSESEEITLDNFTDLVDDASWAEFMPRDVTKEVFESFKRFYEADVFREAGKRIRAIARSADRLPTEERIERIASIFATFRNPDKETVLTPWRVVNMHLSESLGGWCFMDEAFEHTLSAPRYVHRGATTDEVYRPESRILEINSKSGLYPLLATYNVYRKRLEQAQTKYGKELGRAFEDQLWDLTLEQNILVLCKTPMAESITRRTLAGFRDTKVNARYYPNLIEQISKSQTLVAQTLRDGQGFWGINNDTHMKIDAIIGNPPYQEEGLSSRKAPVYHLFYDLAFCISDRVSLITPGRFLFRAGQTPREWMDKILCDNHLKVVRYFTKATDVFPTVDIKGGVVITYRDASADFGPIGFFSEYKELKAIVQKVSAHPSFVPSGFANLISSQGLYRFTDVAFAEHPEIHDVQGTGTAAKITSNAFAQLSTVFLDEEPSQPERFVGILGRSKGQRIYKWIDARYIAPTDGYFESYNVLVPEANGTGAIGEVLSTPVIGVPVIGHTDTFLSIGKFADAHQADRCLKYVKAKFTRCLLGALKATQHNPRETWALVPLQDFGAGSDVDWSGTIEEIDRQLYHKYGLSDEEVAFVERMIKPMD